MQKKKKTLYEFLGIEPEATPEEIKTAAQQLAKKFHPSKYPGNAKVADRFKKIKIVYNTLADPTKRATYDAALAKKMAQNLSSSESGKNTTSTPSPKIISAQSISKTDLREGEQILYQASLHWFSYLTALLIIGIATYLWFEPSVLKMYINQIEFFQDKWLYVKIGLLIILSLGIFLFLTTLLKQFTTTLMLTTERTIAKFGLFLKKRIEIAHIQFDRVHISQSILGTVFQFGHITIKGSHGENVIRVCNVAYPEQFEKQLMRLIKQSA